MADAMLVEVHWHLRAPGLNEMAKGVTLLCGEVMRPSLNDEVFCHRLASQLPDEPLQPHPYAPHGKVVSCPSNWNGTGCFAGSGVSLSTVTFEIGRNEQLPAISSLDIALKKFPNVTGCGNVLSLVR